MELLKIFILKKINEKFGKEEISQPELKHFLCSSLRIEKQIALDVIVQLEVENLIIKKPENNKYLLHENIESYIEKEQNKNHLIIHNKKYKKRKP